MTSSREDALITSLIEGSISWGESFCRRNLARCSYELLSDTFCNAIMEHLPSIVVTEVSYMPKGLTAYTVIDSTKYIVEEANCEAKIVFLEGLNLDLEDRPDAVKITYSGGYTADDVDEDIIIALKLHLGYLYDNRASENKRFPMSAEILLSHYKVYNL